MNKRDLVESVAEATGISKKNVETIVDRSFDTIAATLKGGQDVEVYGFGKFKVKRREQRQGRNPSTGEAITIAARKVAHFTPAKSLADAVA